MYLSAISPTSFSKKKKLYILKSNLIVALINDFVTKRNRNNRGEKPTPPHDYSHHFPFPLLLAVFITTILFHKYIIMCNLYVY